MGKKNNNNLFFACSLIEFIGRKEKRTRCEVVDFLGKDRIQRLYEYARNNLEVELPKREVTIYDIELLDNVWNKEF